MESYAVLTALGFFGFFILLVVLIPAIFFLLTVQNTLKVIQPRNRTMEPGQAWLMLIPLFNIIWQFILVERLSRSIENEFRSKNVPVYSRPCYGVGLAACILNCCSIIPYLGSLFSLAGFICWIIYWVNINDYKNKILRLPPGGDSLIF